MQYMTCVDGAASDWTLAAIARLSECLESVRCEESEPVHVFFIVCLHVSVPTGVRSVLHSLKNHVFDVQSCND